MKTKKNFIFWNSQQVSLLLTEARISVNENKVMYPGPRDATGNEDDYQQKSLSHC